MNVFVSHSKNDGPVAREISDRLAAAGFEVWSDHPAGPGESVSGAIAMAIDCADAYIILVSAHLLDSEFSLLEIGGALAESEASGKLVIPVLLDREIELPALLRDRAWVDISDPSRREAGMATIETALSSTDRTRVRRPSEEERQVELFAAAERYLDEEIAYYLATRDLQERFLRRRSRTAAVLVAALSAILVTLVILAGHRAWPVVAGILGGVLIGMATLVLGSIAGSVWPSRYVVQFLLDRKGSTGYGGD